MYWPDERLYTQVLDIFDLHRGSAFEILKALFCDAGSSRVRADQRDSGGHPVPPGSRAEPIRRTG